MKNTKKICLVACAALVSCALVCGCGSNGGKDPTGQATVPTVGNTKQPSQYTWEEYLAMSEEQKLEFQKRFGSMEVFESWKEMAQREAAAQESAVLPWDNGGKQPQEYTWAEFQALSAEHQMAFQSAMGAEAFEIWMSQNQNKPEEAPWEKPGAKQPEDYTWEEFEELSAEHQMVFQNTLGAEAFDAWMNRAQGRTEPAPWEKSGAKQPGDYTWEEFEALSAEHQVAFQNTLGADGFEVWLNRAQGWTDAAPWEKSGAKQPKDYTWEEFEALSGEHQVAFQNTLGPDGFEAWLNRAEGQTGAAPWDKPGAKQPEDYTWEEFEALSGEDQMAFQNALGEDGFEAWMNYAQGQTGSNPWDQPGAKQPEEYTWAEFEALSGEHQMAFQNTMGAEAFEAWMNRVNP